MKEIQIESIKIHGLELKSIRIPRYLYNFLLYLIK
jgi:hypothetical protein